MDSVQALIFKARRRPSTSWNNAAWTAHTVVNWFSALQRSHGSLQCSPSAPQLYLRDLLLMWGGEGRGNVKEGEGREWESREWRVAPPVVDSESGSEWGGREEGQGGSLGWFAQALVFSTLSTAFHRCVGLLLEGKCAVCAGIARGLSNAAASHRLGRSSSGSQPRSRYWRLQDYWQRSRQEDYHTDPGRWLLLVII